MHSHLHIYMYCIGEAINQLCHQLLPINICFCGKANTLFLFSPVINYYYNCLSYLWLHLFSITDRNASLMSWWLFNGFFFVASSSPPFPRSRLPIRRIHAYRVKSTSSFSPRSFGSTTGRRSRVEKGTLVLRAWLREQLSLSLQRELPKCSHSRHTLPYVCVKALVDVPLQSFPFLHCIMPLLASLDLTSSTDQLLHTSSPVCRTKEERVSEKAGKPKAAPQATQLPQ